MKIDEFVNEIKERQKRKFFTWTDENGNDTLVDVWSAIIGMELFVSELKRRSNYNFEIMDIMN